MNLLEKHFDLAFAAPDGIQKLRELILALAMQGKLVQQDPNDQPASELLKAIEAEKNKLVEDGKFKSLESESPNETDNTQFQIPKGWIWCRLDDISAIARGGSPRPIKSFLTDEPDGLNWIKIGDSDRGKIYINDTKEKIRPEGLKSTRMVFPGDLILSNSMSFGYPYILNIQGCIHDGWLLIRTPDKLISKLFIYYLFLSSYARKAFTKAAAGAVVQNLNADKVRQLLIPLPPLAEQHRIVAKIDRLMARCDELEKLRAERNQKRITIHTAALSRLLSSSSASSLPSSASSLPSSVSSLPSSASSLPSSASSLPSSVSSLPRRRESSSLDSRLRGNDTQASPLDSRLRGNDTQASPLDSRLRGNDTEFAEASPLDSRLRGNDTQASSLDSREGGNDTQASPLDSREGGNDTEFAEAWRFITQHFGKLYSVKENVAELRKAILQLAVMGKLVPQDPTDEPASELLRAIELEKKRLVKEGKIKQPKPLPEIKLEEFPFKLPKGWMWIRLGSLAKSIDYGTSVKSYDDSSKVPVYRMGNIADGQLINGGFKYVDPDIDDLPRLYLKKNDILFNRTNSYELVGKTAIYLGQDDKATFASYLIRVSLVEQYLVPTYFNLVMNASFFRKTQIEPEIVQQCGQANFNGSKLSAALIPVPPPAEQHRIVAKIDQLMALCDRLDHQIDAAASKQTTLLNAVMAQV